jgi:hypothetical protein
VGVKMIATIIKIEKKRSRYGGYFFYCFFKGTDGKAYYTCLYERMRNFKRWSKVMDVGVTLSNLRLVKGKKDNLIDADSRFKLVKEQEQC